MKHNLEFFDMQMRELDQDGPFADLVLLADEALEAFNAMSPAERERNLPDIEEAAALLTMALKVPR
jgi:hypothetical protein